MAHRNQPLAVVMSTTTSAPIDAPASKLGITRIALKLLALMQPYRKTMLLATICGALSSILSLVPYAIIAWLVVQVTQHAGINVQALLWGSAGIVLAMLGEKATFGVATLSAHQAAFSTQRDLRLKLAAHLERVHLGFCEAQSKGELRTLFIDDIEVLEDGMAHLITEVTAAVVTPCLILVILTVFDWRLAVLSATPLVIGGMQLIRMLNRGRSATFEYLSLNAEVASSTAQYTDGLATLRAFDQHDQATKRPRDTFRRMSQFSNRWLQSAVIPGTSAQVLLSSPLLLVAPVGLWMVWSGHCSLATWIFCTALTFGFGDLFATVHGLSHRLLQQAQLLERLDHCLAHPAMIGLSPVLEPKDATLAFEHVQFHYGTIRALTDITFTLKPGGCLALVGSSGSGKTTLARLIARFEDPSGGRIVLGGVDIRQMRTEMLYQKVGFVFQDVFLFAGSVAENIRLGRPGASDAEIVEAARAAQAHDFIERLPRGYATQLGENGQGLSGGERQRLSIARAILKNPPILLLDEATAFADPENESLIQQAIRRVTAGRSVVVVAHRLQTIVHAEEILVLRGGEIVERGTHGYLLSLGGRYAQMWHASQQELAG